MRKPLAAEEKLRRLQEGLCLYCGEKGHEAMWCWEAALQDIRNDRQTPRAECIWEAVAKEELSLASLKKLLGMERRPQGDPEIPPTPPAPVAETETPATPPATPEPEEEELHLSAFAVSEIEISRMDGEHLIVQCTLTIGSRKIRTHALVDSGATGSCFVDQQFAREHVLPLHALPEPRSLEVIDGRPIESGQITHVAKFGLAIEEHQEELAAFVTKLGQYPVVLGIPWLRLHDVMVRFADNSLTFGSKRCQLQCTPGKHDYRITGTTTPPRHLEISAIGLAPYHLLARKSKETGDKCFALSLAGVNEALTTVTPTEPPPTAEEELTKIKQHLPQEYHDLADVFRKTAAAKLPPHRTYDHSIEVEDGFTPPFGPLYSLSRPELETLKKWLEENLEKGFIRASSSPAGAPVLFVKKKDGTLRVCVDYRGLNKGTVKNRYPLPLIKETLAQLQKAKYYTKLDIRDAYNMVRIKEGDEWKTAFRTRWGLFESLVMPFGLTNAPATFQHFINDVLRPWLDHFCTAYLDDVLIYSESLREHQQHVRTILKALQAAGLYVKVEKCEFHVQKIEYLGLVITTEGLEMDPAKIETVQLWPLPEKLKDVQAFLGFANFYRRFIKDYSKIVQPLTALTKKNTPFE